MFPLALGRAFFIFGVVVVHASFAETTVKCHLHARLDGDDGPAVCLLTNPMPASAVELAEHVSGLCWKYLVADCDAVFSTVRKAYIQKHQEHGLNVDIRSVNSMRLHKPRKDHLATVEATNPDWQELAEAIFLNSLRSKGKDFASIMTVRTTMDWAIGDSILHEPHAKRQAYMVSTCWRALYEVLVHTSETVYDRRSVWEEPIRKASKWTNFRINDAIGTILGLLHVKYTIGLATKGILGPFDASEAERALHGLNTNGYYILPHTKLSHAVLEKFQTGVAALTYAKPFNLDLRDGSVNFAEDMDQVVQIMPSVLDLMTDPTLLHIVQEYLGCAPVNTNIHTWWSVSGGTKAASTQKWHQDMDWIKWIKVFLYLNDTNRSNGAHRYIPGSFKNFTPLLPTILKYNKEYRFGHRISDAQIEHMYPGKLMYMEGAAGTIVLEDTRGFHSGTFVKEGYRQVMQLEFAVSDYKYQGKQGRRPICESSLSHEQRERFATYPRLFQRFLDDNGGERLTEGGNGCFDIHRKPIVRETYCADDHDQTE